MTGLYKANKENIIIARDFLESGKIVCLPTETVYGLSCLMNDTKAIERISKLKKRDKNKAFAVLCSDIEKIKEIAHLNMKSIELIDKYMPGPITLILDAKITNIETIAVRIPDNKFTLDLLKLINKPLIATSVNISNKLPASKIEDIEISVYNQIDLIIDDGPCKLGVPSCLINVRNNKMEIIRKGPINII